MYIERHEFLFRPGCLEDAVALTKNEIQITSAIARVLTPYYAQWDHLILELAFQEMADPGKFWGNWSNLPTTQKFWEQWLPLALPGGSTSLWQVVDPAACFPPGKIVNRRTWMVRSGKMDDLVGLLKGERGKGDNPWDISTAVYGPKDMVAGDFVSESLAANEQSWDEWGTSERTKIFFEKWDQLVESGGASEIWEAR